MIKFLKAFVIEGKYKNITLDYDNHKKTLVVKTNAELNIKTNDNKLDGFLSHSFVNSFHRF